MFLTIPYIFPCRLCSPMLTTFLPSVWGVSIIISLRSMHFSWSSPSHLHELSSYTYLGHLRDFSRRPLPKLSLRAILFDPLFILASNLLVLYPISKRGVCQKGSLLILGSSPLILFYELELSSWVLTPHFYWPFQLYKLSICATSFISLFILACIFLFHTSMPSLIPLLISASTSSNEISWDCHHRHCSMSMGFLLVSLIIYCWWSFQQDASSIPLLISASSTLAMTMIQRWSSVSWLSSIPPTVFWVSANTQPVTKHGAVFDGIKVVMQSIPVLSLMRLQWGWSPKGDLLALDICCYIASGRSHYLHLYR